MRTSPDSPLPDRGFPSARTRVLDVDVRSCIDQELIPAGIEVLFNEIAPLEIRRATPQSRARFKSLGFAWTDRTRQRLAFPEESDPHYDPKFTRLLDGLAIRAEEFTSTLDRAMRDAAERRVGGPLPRRGLLRYLAGVPSISGCAVAELPMASDEDVFGLGGGAQVEIPRRWRERVQRIGRGRLYRLVTGGGEVDVVVCPVVRLEASPCAPMRLKEVAARDLEAVRRRVDEVRGTSGFSKPRLTMLVIGAITGRSEDLRGDRRGAGEWIAVATPRKDALPGSDVSPYRSRWRVGRPRERGRDWAMAVFRERVLPEDRERRSELVVRAYEHWRTEGDGSDFSIRKAKELTELEDDALLWAFHDLSGSKDGRFRVQRESNLGLVLREIGSARTGATWSLPTRSDSLGGRLLKWVTSVGTLTALIGGALRDPPFYQRWGQVALFILIPLAAFVLSAVLRRALPTTELAND